jgi:hypothetical protein
LADAADKVRVVVEDAPTIARILGLAKYSWPFGVDAGGFMRGCQVHLFSAGKELASFGIGDYDEWGYDGRVQGFSQELAELVQGMVYRARR